MADSEYPCQQLLLRAVLRLNSGSDQRSRLLPADASEVIEQAVFGERKGVACEQRSDWIDAPRKNATISLALPSLSI
jgi:hypothetical protein